MAALPRAFFYLIWIPCCGPATPGSKPPGLGYCRFARHYSGNLVLISLPAGTEMFQFPAFASYGYFTHRRIPGHYSRWVSPFGHVRVIALLAAHRTLSWPNTVLHRQHVPRHPPRALSRLSNIALEIFRTFRLNDDVPNPVTMLAFYLKTSKNSIDQSETKPPLSSQT